MSLDETWRRLANNIREIFAQNAANLSFEENHRFGYNLVLGKQSEKLYEGVKALVVENLQKMIKDKLIPAFPTGVRSDMISRAKEGEELLKAFKCVWDDHESGLCKLRDILKYLVRLPPPFLLPSPSVAEALICPRIECMHQRNTSPSSTMPVSYYSTHI
jgi:cullin 3